MDLKQETAGDAEASIADFVGDGGHGDDSEALGGGGGGGLRRSSWSPIIGYH